jgi:hypothetical protein
MQKNEFGNTGFLKPAVSTQQLAITWQLASSLHQLCASTEDILVLRGGVI